MTSGLIGGFGRPFLLGLALLCAVSLAACGKAGPLEPPQISAGVDEEGNEIKKPAPPADFNKPFILDRLLR
ncbi:MAG: hypothetical protein AAGF59_06135 [Pseudomonadota bacterium]